MFITIVLAIVLVFLALLYRKRQGQINVFKSMGIPGPEPHWLTGTQTEFDKKNGFETIRDWTKKYGKVYGYYEGPVPVLVMSDPEMLKEVFVKQFSSFHGRKRFPISPNPNSGTNANMLDVYGSRWKRLRSIINPTFSAAKLKQINPLVRNKVDIFIEKVSRYAEEGSSVDIHKDFQALTLDVIGEVAFGMEVDSQRNQQEPFLVHVKAAFDMVAARKRPAIVTAGLFFPELRDFLYNVVIHIVTRIAPWPWFWLQEQLGKVIEMRRKTKSSRKDLLQLMLDAEADAEDVKNVNMWGIKDDNTSDAKLNIGTHASNRKLTNLEIRNQGTLFLLAGYDTTSNLLAYLAYLLATNPHKQDILQAEIDEYLQENDLNDVDKLQKLRYLDMVICEALRLYPVAASIVNRTCMEPCTINGIHIPEGMIVQADSMAVHYDADLWGPTDTSLFEPERFSEEYRADRHPMAWIPFGIGPRNCVGMRLALMESKLTVARIMSEFSFEKSEKTEEPLKVYEAATITPENGLYVKIARRQVPQKQM